MTTSTNESETEVLEPEGPRSIDQLWDLPYSEMTDDEIALIIQYKADIQTRDELHSAKMTALKQTFEEVAQSHRDAAQHAKDVLDQLTQHAIDRYLEVSSEQTQ